MCGEGRRDKAKDGKETGAGAAGAEEGEAATKVARRRRRQDGVWLRGRNPRNFGGEDIVTGEQRKGIPHGAAGHFADENRLLSGSLEGPVANSLTIY